MRTNLAFGNAFAKFWYSANHAKRGEPPSKTEGNMPQSVVVLRVSLEAEIYRDIEISGDASLYNLAEVINNVFGFDFDHAFGFYDNKKNPYKSKEFYELFKDMGDDPQPGSQSVKKSKVADAFNRDGKSMVFLFDYGDEWLFEVKRTEARDKPAPKAFWKLLKSVGEAPPQYPSDEEDDDDDRPFNEKYEMRKVGDLTVVTRRPKP
jgi:Plasmid pRiA4b ORF-3-like protein